MSGISAANQAVLDFMRSHLQQEDRLPTMAEICRQFLWTSPNAALYHIKRLKDLGVIEARSNGAYRLARSPA